MLPIVGIVCPETLVGNKLKSFLILSMKYIILTLLLSSFVAQAQKSVMVNSQGVVVYPDNATIAVNSLTGKTNVNADLEIRSSVQPNGEPNDILIEATDGDQDGGDVIIRAGEGAETDGSVIINDRIIVSAFDTSIEGNLDVEGEITSFGFSTTGGLVECFDLTVTGLSTFNTVAYTYTFWTESGQLTASSYNYADATGDNLDFSLPDPAGYPVGITPIISIKRMDMTANTITITPDAGTIDGLASINIIPFRAYTFAHNRTNWFSVGDAVGRGTANTILAMDASGNSSVFKDLVVLPPFQVINSDTQIKIQSISTNAILLTSAVSPYEVAEEDGFMKIDTTAGNVEAILPPPSSFMPLKEYIVKKIVAANTVTVSTAGAETIDGAATDTLTTQWTARTYISDGTNWFIIGN